MVALWVSRWATRKVTVGLLVVQSKDLWDMLWLILGMEKLIVCDCEWEAALRFALRIREGLKFEQGGRGRAVLQKVHLASSFTALCVLSF